MQFPKSMYKTTKNITKKVYLRMQKKYILKKTINKHTEMVDILKELEQESQILGEKGLYMEVRDFYMYIQIGMLKNLVK